MNQKTCNMDKNKKIEIIFLEHGFDVVFGDKSTEQLSFDEMLGVVAQLTMPDTKPCLNWLKTKEEHKKSMIKLKT